MPRPPATTLKKAKITNGEIECEGKFFVSVLSDKDKSNCSCKKWSLPICSLLTRKSKITRASFIETMMMVAIVYEYSIFKKIADSYKGPF